MKRILVPLDGSLLAEAILPIAEEWAKEEEAEIVLLRAVRAHRVPGRDAVDAETEAVAEGETYLKGIAERLERRGLKRVRWVVWYSGPAEAIIHAVGVYGVDLIAMATHGRSGLSRLLLGSVAEAVARAAPVPVLMIRGQSAWKPWATGKILVPLDRSQTSEAILPVVERVAGPRDLMIFLLEVIEPIPSAVKAETPLGFEDMVSLRREDAERYLAKAAEPLREKGLRVEWAVQHGMPAERIAAAAAQESVDLIAMATHGRSGLGRLFFGSVAEGVLRSSTVPVLLFKAAETSGAR